MRTLLKWCIAAALLTTTDSWAYCIYNDSDTKVFLTARGMGMGRWIEPGQNVCCNYGDESCNKSGQRDTVIDFQLKVEIERKNGYYGDESHGDIPKQCGVYTPPLPFALDTWILKVQAGGYARVVNHPSFKNTHWISYSNPAYLVRTFNVDDKQIDEYPCPNVKSKGTAVTLREGPHGERMDFIESDRPANDVKMIGYARKCLTASARRVDAPLQLFTCDKKDSQRWNVLGDAVRLNGSNLCIANKTLTVRGIKSPFPMILLDTCSGAAEQKVYVKDDRIKYGDECLDVQATDARDGTGIILYRCKGDWEGAGNQRWIPTP